MLKKHGLIGKNARIHQPMRPDTPDAATAAYLEKENTPGNPGYVQTPGETGASPWHPHKAACQWKRVLNSIQRKKANNKTIIRERITGETTPIRNMSNSPRRQNDIKRMAMKYFGMDKREICPGALRNLIGQLHKEHGHVEACLKVRPAFEWDEDAAREHFEALGFKYIGTVEPHKWDKYDRMVLVAVEATEINEEMWSIFNNLIELPEVTRRHVQRDMATLQKHHHEQGKADEWVGMMKLSAGVTRGGGQGVSVRVILPQERDTRQAAGGDKETVFTQVVVFAGYLGKELLASVVKRRADAKMTGALLTMQAMEESEKANDSEMSPTHSKRVGVCQAFDENYKPAKSGEPPFEYIWEALAGKGRLNTRMKPYNRPGHRAVGRASIEIDLERNPDGPSYMVAMENALREIANDLENEQGHEIKLHWHTADTKKHAIKSNLSFLQNGLYILTKDRIDSDTLAIAIMELGFSAPIAMTPHTFYAPETKHMINITRVMMGGSERESARNALMNSKLIITTNQQVTKAEAQIMWSSATGDQKDIIQAATQRAQGSTVFIPTTFKLEGPWLQLPENWPNPSQKDREDSRDEFSIVPAPNWETLEETTHGSFKPKQTKKAAIGQEARKRNSVMKNLTMEAVHKKMEVAAEAQAVVIAQAQETRMAVDMVAQKKAIDQVQSGREIGNQKTEQNKYPVHVAVEKVKKTGIEAESGIGGEGENKQQGEGTYTEGKDKNNSREGKPRRGEERNCSTVKKNTLNLTETVTHTPSTEHDNSRKKAVQGTRRRAGELWGRPGSRTSGHTRLAHHKRQLWRQRRGPATAPVQKRVHDHPRAEGPGRGGRHNGAKTGTYQGNNIGHTWQSARTEHRVQGEGEQGSKEEQGERHGRVQGEDGVHGDYPSRIQTRVGTRRASKGGSEHQLPKQGLSPKEEEIKRGEREGTCRPASIKHSTNTSPSTSTELYTSPRPCTSKNPDQPSPAGQWKGVHPVRLGTTSRAEQNTGRIPTDSSEARPGRRRKQRHRSRRGNRHGVRHGRRWGRRRTHRDRRRRGRSQQGGRARRRARVLTRGSRKGTGRPGNGQQSLINPEGEYCNKQERQKRARRTEVRTHTEQSTPRPQKTLSIRNVRNKNHPHQLNKKCNRRGNKCPQKTKKLEQHKANGAAKAAQLSREKRTRVR